MVDRGGLENRCTFAGTQGSNPCLSAKYIENPSFISGKIGVYVHYSYFLILPQTHDIKSLFREISAGNRNAFDALFRGRYEKLVWFAQTFVSENAVAEEIVSDVFVWLWQHREKLQEIDNPEVYLFTAVKNRCFNSLRSKTHNVPIEEQPDAQRTDYESPHDEMEHRELYQRLNEVVNQLPEQQRIVFRMVKESGLSAKQCARILNLSPRTVETHLYKAVQKLEKEITDYLGYSPKKKKMRRMIMLVV